MGALKNIGQLIQQRRDHMNITQKQLADMADVGINTLYKIETGQANPTFESLQKLQISSEWKLHYRSKSMSNK